MSVAAEVRRVVGEDPVLRECLARGLVNYSEAARRVRAELERRGLRASLASVKMALIRLSEKLKASSFEDVERIIASSRLAVQDDIAVLTVPRDELMSALRAVGRLLPESRFLQIIQSIKTATIIVAEEDLDRLARSFKRVESVIRGQSTIIIISPPEIVETPGVLYYLTGFLAHNGINITQVVSCYLDTILVMSKSEAVRAYQLLHKLIDKLKEKHGLPR